MALSYIGYTGNGVAKQFALPFGFLAKDNISVKVNGVAAPFTFLSNSLVSINVAPAAGASVEIRRTTKRDVLAVPFADSSTLTQADLDRSHRQLLYLAQEAIEAPLISATEAAGYAAAALATLGQFRDRYFGASPVTPTTKPSGASLQSGDLYYNTTTNSLMIYSTIGGWGAYAPSKPVSQRGTIAITVDLYRDVYDLLRYDLSNKGIRLTYFVVPEDINVGGYFQDQDLLAMLSYNWEVGAYTNVDMVALAAIDRITPYNRMIAMRNKMREFKIETLSIAPRSRLWNEFLAGLSRQVFRNVRTADDISAFASYPIKDRNNVRKGASESFAGTTTLSWLKDKTDAVIADGGLWVPNFHQYGNTPDAYTVTPSVILPWLDYLHAKMNAGVLRSANFNEAMEPAA